MKFIKRRAHTILYSNQVKAGMKGYVANSLYALMSDVKEENPSALRTIVRVHPDGYGDMCFEDDNHYVWKYFYPIEEESR